MDTMTITACFKSLGLFAWAIVVAVLERWPR